MTYRDFVASAVAILPAMDAASGGASLGQTVLDAVSATRKAIGKNTNLGTILLLGILVLYWLYDRAIGINKMKLG